MLILEKKYQRSCFYIKFLNESQVDLNRFKFNTRMQNDFPESLSQEECLRKLLDYSELKSPNWCEVNNFINFLDNQLEVLEQNDFVDKVSDFRSIFAKLIIMMAYDFGLPSLNIGEESNAFRISEDNQVILHSLYSG